MAARLPNTIAILRKRTRPMFAITLIANRGAIPAFSPVIPARSPVIPAKAGIQRVGNGVYAPPFPLDFGFRHPRARYVSPP